MNQLTTIELAKRAGFNITFVVNTESLLEKFRALIIEAEHQRLLGVGMEPVAYLYHDASSLDVLLSNERNGFPVNSVFLGIKRREYCRNETPLYTADQQAAARLQDQQKIAEQVSIAVSNAVANWANANPETVSSQNHALCKRIREADARIAELEAKELDLYKQLAEAKLSALNGWQRYEQANSHRKGLLEAQLAERKPLTDEEIDDLWAEHENGSVFDVHDFARAIEAAHGIRDKA